ncbi:MAG: PIG-L deacetylase family protein, partial [Promethearchaeota archaeon]
MHKKKSYRILVIVAHPDDADLLTGGSTIRWTKRGDIVKYLIMTNGNMGHQEENPELLSIRRNLEGMAAAKILNAEYECLGIDDGQIYVNSENLRLLIHKIRQFAPDLIITHRSCDYHRDHRYTSQLVMDSSYMLIVPHYYPEVPPYSRKLPIICYGMDSFIRPYLFIPHVIIDISEEISEKYRAIACHESQVFEWLPWTAGREKQAKIALKLNQKSKIIEQLESELFGKLHKRIQLLLK